MDVGPAFAPLLQEALAGPQKTHITALEERIADLEEQLRQASGRPAPVTRKSSVGPTVREIELERQLAHLQQALEVCCSTPFGVLWRFLAPGQIGFPSKGVWVGLVMLINEDVGGPGIDPA